MRGVEGRRRENDSHIIGAIHNGQSIERGLEVDVAALPSH